MIDVINQVFLGLSLIVGCVVIPYLLFTAK